MNRKGFTLIEIIMCVVLIAIIGIVVGVNSDKLFSKKTKEDVTQTIISAAEVYTNGNAGVVEKLYNGYGFVTVTIKELREDGLISEDIVDENGNAISDETPVLVTLNEDGYLEFTYEKDDSLQGYVVANALTIAKGDDFKCTHFVGVTGGLIFNDKNGLNISSNLSYVTSISGDNQYTCEENIDGNTPGTYNVKYTYQIDGVLKSKTRQVIVLDEFDYSINTDNFVTNQHYMEEKSANNYTLYTTNDTYNLKINTSYDSEPIQIVYEKDSTKQSSNTFNDLVEGTYTFKINVVDKKTTYTDSELISKTDYITSKTFTLTIKKVPTLEITNIVFKNANNTTVSGTTWNTGKKVSVSLSNEEIIEKKEYKLDTDSTYKELKNDLITTPANKITIKVTDKLGRTITKEYNINIDVMPTSPTVSSGASTSYTPTKTFALKLPTNTLSGSTYYYSLGNTTPTSSGTSFTSTSLTINANSLNSDNIKYLYLRTCNKVGCSSWTQANAYITKKINEWSDTNCTKDTSNNNICHYIGSKSNNYVRYGGKLWRIYKKTSGKLGLILDSNYTSTAYGQVGKCTASCCNYGRYLYRYLGDTDRNSSTYTSYGFKYQTMGSTLSGFKLSDTSLLESFTNVYTSVKVGLLSRYDYMKVAKCSSDTSCTYASSNYIKSGKSAFWLVDSGNAFNGDRGNYNTNVFAYAYNYSVDTYGKLITTVGSEANSGTITTKTLAVRPIVQIKSTAKITGGNGTYNNPYTLG